MPVHVGATGETLTITNQAVKVLGFIGERYLRE